MMCPTCVGLINHPPIGQWSNARYILHMEPYVGVGREMSSDRFTANALYIYIF